MYKLIEDERPFFEKYSRRYDIVAFFLFGSHASKTTTRLSDLDIGYLPSQPLSSNQESELYVALMRQLKRDDIDLVDLSRVSLLLQFAVIRQGEVIVCSDPIVLQQFVVETRRDYLDTQHLRDLFAQYRMERIADGSFGESA